MIRRVTGIVTKVVVVIVLLASVALAVHNTTQLQAQQRASAKNRVANVLTWCGALNTDRRVLSLSPLPCNQIAHRTAQSSK